MVLRERQESKGQVTILLRDRQGKVVDERRSCNLIVSSGKALAANLFRGMEKKPVSHMAVGTGSTAPHPSDTELEAELPPRRPFDTNLFSEEAAATLVVPSEGGKESFRLTARKVGPEGNNIGVMVTNVRKKNFDVHILDSTGEGVEETYERVTMDPDDPNFVVKRINDSSQLVKATFLSKLMPIGEDRWKPLEGGSDAVVTLAATFGYEDGNGPLTEAGIFNASEKGTMYNRVVFPEINKTDKLTLSLIWKVSF